MASKRRSPPVTPLQVPTYSQVAWLYGRRLRTSAGVDRHELHAEVAREIAQRAQARALAPADLHGLTPSPLGAPTELVLGAILNGAPVVRDTPEMREGVLAREHRAVAARFSLTGRAMGSSDEDLTVESDWGTELGALLDEVEASEIGRQLMAERVPVQIELASDIPLWDDVTELPPSGLAWHLVARLPGAGGALMYGALLPSAGDSYGDDLVETVSLTSSADDLTVRVVGAPVLLVDAARPLATLPAQPSKVWENQVLRRIETMTGRFRPCNYWLVAR